MPLEKERFGLCLASMTIGGGDQLFGLRNSKRGKKIGEDRLQRAAEPDIEEIRQISVADIVVIRRISGDNCVSQSFACCVTLPRDAVAVRPQSFKNFSNPVGRVEEIRR